MAVNCKKQSRAARFGSLLSGVVMLLYACGPKSQNGLCAGPESKVIAIQDDASLKLEDGFIAHLAALDCLQGLAAPVENLKRAALGR